MRKCCTVLGIFLLLASGCLTIFNVWEDKKAAGDADVLMDGLKESMERENQALNEEGNPSIMVNEQECMGYLGIPSLDLELPVLSEWSYKKLKSAPCRYDGSVKNNNLIVMAHNYERHFGRLKELTVGDTIEFTDVFGNSYRYFVFEVGRLKPDEMDKLRDAEAGLTLFTCTYGGEKRVVVRCK